MYGNYLVVPISGQLSHSGFFVEFWIPWTIMMNILVQTASRPDGKYNRECHKYNTQCWYLPSNGTCSWYNRPNFKVGNTSSNQGILRVVVTGIFSFYQLDNNKDICGLGSLVVLTQSLNSYTLLFTINLLTVRHCYKLHTQSNKNPSAWYFVRPAQAVTCCTVAIIIRVVFLSPYLRIRGVSLSSIHYNQSHGVYINRKQKYISIISN